MSPVQSLKCLETAVLLVASLGVTAAAAGQDETPARPPQSQPRTVTPGFEVFGHIATNWPAAGDSFEAAGLDARPVEFGGGVQASNVWRNLFVRFDVGRWSDSGERAFIDASGTRFPLGIPLDVTATFLDVSSGWEFAFGGSPARPRLLPYVGAGAGVVFYKEESPFAEADENVDEGTASYHALAGIQVRLLNWLGVGFDVRYRYVPDLLGRGGVSAVLREDAFGGAQASVGVRFGFRGTRPASAAPREAERTPLEAPAGAAQPTTPVRRSGEATMIEAAPAFLRPDSSRPPLRVLERGARLQVLEVRGDWLLVEFDDPQYGPRRGYVERKYVRVPQQD